MKRKSAKVQECEREGSTEEKTEICEGLFVPSRTHDCTTSLLSICIRLFCVFQFSTFSVVSIHPVG